MGGTGAPIAAGGLGGTGAPLPDAPGDGGIGGTGMPVAQGEAVGIVGIVTGFASVCVNGLEVHYEANTPISENGRSADAGALAVGQVVSIEAVATPGGLRARDVAIVHVLEGPVTRSPGGGLAVMGQRLALLPGARVAAGANALAPGQMVKVSGLRTPAGQIQATRVAPAPGLAVASAIGEAPPTGPGTVRLVVEPSPRLP